MKRVAIVQSNYVPWKGYFDLIASVDEFIFLDDVQFTRGDWRNRNRIKTAQGLAWLTIPVRTRGRYGQRIDEVEIADPGWNLAHLRTLTRAYRAAPCFADWEPWLRQLYLGSASLRLSEVNRRFIETICAELAIETKLSRSSDYDATGSKSERLLALCLEAGADQYVSGPRARAYLDEALFDDAGIPVSWFDYSGYREYPQLHPPFEHRVSVLDLILHTGAGARDHLKAPIPTAAPARSDSSVPG
jgi:WbqC-like protein family